MFLKMLCLVAIICYLVYRIIQITQYTKVVDWVYEYAMPLIILSFIILILIQMHVPFFYDFANYITPGSHENWMSFWGSYLGVIASGLITYSIFKRQLDNDRKRKIELDEDERRRYKNRYIYEGIADNSDLLNEHFMNMQKFIQVIYRESFELECLLAEHAKAYQQKDEKKKEELSDQIDHVSDSRDNMQDLVRNIASSVSNFRLKYATTIDTSDIDNNIMNELNKTIGLIDHNYNSTDVTVPYYKAMEGINKILGNFTSIVKLQIILELFNKIHGDFIDKNNKMVNSNVIDRADKLKDINKNTLFQMTFILWYAHSLCIDTLREIEI